MAARKKKSQSIKPKENIPKQKRVSKKNNSFPIVAIGASAGGLEAFEKFFMHVSACLCCHYSSRS